MKYLVWICLLGLPAAAQSLRVYSEFQRVDPFGRIVAADRGEPPREILSPAMARNAFTSFHVIVEVPPESPYELYIGLNPEDAVKVTLYKEIFRRAGNGWVPDRLVKVREPYSGILPDEDQTVRNQRIAAFWLDVWVPSAATVERIKVEPQLLINNQWVVYPMEARIVEARAPALPHPFRAPLPGPAASADAPVLAPLRGYLCGAEESVQTPGLSIRHMIRRNASQDMMLARALQLQRGKTAITQAFVQRLGLEETGLESWCADRSAPVPQGAEWYLRVRDFLNRGALN